MFKITEEELTNEVRNNSTQYLSRTSDQTRENVSFNLNPIKLPPITNFNKTEF